MLTVESFDKQESGDAEEDEEIDDLLAMVFDVMSDVFEEDRPSRRHSERRFSGRTERVITQVMTARNTTSIVDTHHLVC